jgi:hypothetical protein
MTIQEENAMAALIGITAGLLIAPLFALLLIG